MYGLEILLESYSKYVFYYFLSYYNTVFYYNIAVDIL